MTRIIGSMVMHNEADRYLEKNILWMQQYLDEIFIYDDRSTDDSVLIAKALDCTVIVRPEDQPSFLEHEGRFRSSAFVELKYAMKMQPGMWILSFDADEFLVGTQVEAEVALQQAIDVANKKSYAGVILPFPEIFAVKDGVPQERRDGFWGQIKGPRLYQFRDDAQWHNKAMGCGSEPTYVDPRRCSTVNFGLHMLHYGYARDEDKQAKYKRYTSLVDNGHNDSHIQSILKPPTLAPWKGPIPDVGDTK